MLNLLKENCEVASETGGDVSLEADEPKFILKTEPEELLILAPSYRDVLNSVDQTNYSNLSKPKQGSKRKHRDFPE